MISGNQNELGNESPEIEVDFENDDEEMESEERVEDIGRVRNVQESLVLKEKWLLDRMLKNRDQHHYVVLEKIPIVVALLMFVAFVIIVLMGIVIGVFGGPSTMISQDDSMNRDPVFVQHFFNGLTTFTGEIGGLEPLNQELTVSLIFKNKYSEEALPDKENAFGFIMNDLAMRIHYEHSDNGKDFRSIGEDRVQHRKLVCTQAKYECEPMILTYSPTISAEYYRVSVTLKEGSRFIHKHHHFERVVEDEIDMRFRTFDTAYGRWEIGFRYTFSIISVVFAFLFITYLVLRQQFAFWTMEQKWISILLILLILYNNPLIAFHLVDTTWILPFVNILFVATFICYLMLTILVVSHAPLRPKKRRGWLSFYLPKFILVGFMWVMFVFGFTYARLRERRDPSFDPQEEMSDVASRETIALIVLTTIFLYGFNVVYYIIRGIGKWKAKELEKKYSKRFFIVWLFTIFIIVATVVDVSLLIWRTTWSNSAQFFIFWVMYNFYCYFIAVFQLPLKIKDEEEVEQEDRNLENAEELRYQQLG